MKHFFTAFCAELKLLYKSFWSVVYFVPMVLMTIDTLRAFAGENMGNLGSWVNCNGYTTVYTSFAALIIGVFAAHSQNDLLRQLFTPLARTNIKLFSALLFTSSYVLFGVAVILVYDIVRPVEAGLLLNYIAYTVVLWLKQRIFFTCAGFFIGTAITSDVAYFLTVIPILLFSLFLPVFAYSSALSLITGLPQFVFELLNSNIDNPTVTKFLSQGISFNTFFWLDKFFIILLGALCWTLSVYINKRRAYARRSGREAAGVLCALFLVAADVFGAGCSAPKYLGFSDSGLKQKLKSGKIESSIKVISYKMDTCLRERFKNTCEMKIRFSGASKDLKLTLDDAFKVDSVYIDGKKAGFTRRGDSLTVSAAGIQSGETADVTLYYHGRIDYSGEFGSRSIYADNSCSYLPERFAWYPFPGDAPAKNAYYDITLHAGNTVVTNLKNAANRLTGKTDGIYISTGYYKTRTVGGVKVICADELSDLDTVKGTIKMIRDEKTISGLDYSENNFFQPNENVKKVDSLLKKGRIVCLPLSYQMDYDFDGDIITIE